MVGSDHHHFPHFASHWTSHSWGQWRLTWKHAWLPTLFHLAFQWGRQVESECCPRDLGRGKVHHCPNLTKEPLRQLGTQFWHSSFREAGRDNRALPWMCLKGHLRPAQCPQGRQPGLDFPRYNGWAGLSRGCCGEDDNDWATWEVCGTCITTPHPLSNPFHKWENIHH